jgi:hypothetical protein
MNPLAFLWRKKKESTILVPKAEQDINTQYPQGFFSVVNLAGKPAGLGFWCRRCRLHIPHGAHATVFHCGRIDTLNPEASLPTVKLNSPDLPPAFAGRTLIDPDENAWDGTVGYDGNRGGWGWR